MAYIPMHNTIDYIELCATDPEKSGEFFRALFGWKFTSYGPDYLAFDDGRLNGGFSRVDAGTTFQRGGVLVVFHSDDLEQTLNKVEQLSATVTIPIFEFPGGRRFHFLGPDQIEYAVWSA